MCLCLNEGQMESYLHALTSHGGLVEGHYATHALLRDPHRAHLLLMMTAGLEHLKFTIPTVSMHYSLLYLYMWLLET